MRQSEAYALLADNGAVEGETLVRDGPQEALFEVLHGDGKEWGVGERRE